MREFKDVAIELIAESDCRTWWEPRDEDRSFGVACFSCEFRLDESSIPSGSDFYVSSRNLNDGSVEGLAHRTLPIKTYQYHPEGAPGPRDNEPAFDEFMSDVREAVSRK